MKFSSMIAAGLICLAGGNAFAQGPIAEAHQAIRQNHHDIAVEKDNLAQDRQAARLEAHDVRAVERRQQALRARGDYRGARQLERERQHQANQARIARRQVEHDRNVIAIKHQQIAHQKNVIAIRRDERARGNGY